MPNIQKRIHSFVKRRAHCRIQPASQKTKNWSLSQNPDIKLSLFCTIHTFFPCSFQYKSKSWKNLTIKLFHYVILIAKAVKWILPACKNIETVQHMRNKILSIPQYLDKSSMPAGKKNNYLFIYLECKYLQLVFCSHWMSKSKYQGCPKYKATKKQGHAKEQNFYMHENFLSSFQLRVS